MKLSGHLYRCTFMFMVTCRGVLCIDRWSDMIVSNSGSVA